MMFAEVLDTPLQIHCKIFKVLLNTLQGHRQYITVQTNEEVNIALLIPCYPTTDRTLSITV